MRLYPKQWTHHHAHRLFHISVGLCFAFVALTILAGMLVVWVGAHAQSQGDLLDISAVVIGINPGPITHGTTSGSVPRGPSANPTITILAEPQGQIPQAPLPIGQMVFPAYVFPTGNPTFSGQTSVPNGLIFLTIQGPQPFNSTALASSTGNWLWQSPLTLAPGTYFIRATVYDPNDLSKSGTASTYFIISAPAPTIVPPIPGTPTAPPAAPPQPGTTPPVNSSPGSVPGQGSQPPTSPTPTPEVPAGPIKPIPTTPTDQGFGIFLEILKDYKSISVGNHIVVAITLVNKNSDQEIPNQVINYQVIAEDGSVIMESSDTVSFSQISRYLKTILTAPGTKPGTYRLIVSSTYRGITSTASDTFVLRPAVPTPTPPGPSQPVILWSALAGLLLLFLLLIAIAYYQVIIVSRHIKEHNDRYHGDKEKDLS
jgi:hypothetical protein